MPDESDRQRVLLLDEVRALRAESERLRQELAKTWASESERNKTAKRWASAWKAAAKSRKHGEAIGAHAVAVLSRLLDEEKAKHAELVRLVREHLAAYKTVVLHPVGDDEGYRKVLKHEARCIEALFNGVRGDPGASGSGEGT